MEWERNNETKFESEIGDVLDREYNMFINNNDDLPTEKKTGSVKKFV